MSTSTLSHKGQTTIPKKIREQLGVQAGDRIEYIVDAEGRVILLPATRHVEALAGLLHEVAPAKAVPLEEMEAAIREGAGG
jgi:AbrB family looped-hinge helix DNA binding protein